MPRLCKDQTPANQQSEVRKRGLVSTGAFLEGFLERVGASCLERAGVGLDAVGCHNSPGQAWCRGGDSRRRAVGPRQTLSSGLREEVEAVSPETRSAFCLRCDLIIP